MKKSLLALAIAGGAAVLISPKFIGDSASTELSQAVAKFNDIPGYNVTITSEEKSWFSSQTTLNVSFNWEQMDPSVVNNPEMADVIDMFKFDLVVDMQHGPILLDKGIGLSDIQIQIPNKSDDITNDGEVIKNFYHFDAMLNLMGELSYNDIISGMQIDLQEGQGRFNFSGYEGTGETNNGIVNYKADASLVEFKMPGIDMTMSDMKVNWDGEFDLAKLMKGIYSNSDTSIVIDNFEVTQAAQPLFGWDNLELYGKTIVDDLNIIDMHVGYRIASVQTPIDNFEEVEIAFEFNNVDGQFMETYQEMLMPLQTQQQTPEELLQKFQGPLIAMLAKQPEMKISNIGFKTATGTMKSEASLNLANYDVEANQFADETFWKNNLVVDSALALPKDMALDLVQKGLLMQFQADPSAAEYTPGQLQEIAVQQAQATVDGLMQGGFLVEQDGQLQLNFNVLNGVANLNGNEIPLDALLPAE